MPGGRWSSACAAPPPWLIVCTLRPILDEGARRGDRGGVSDPPPNRATARERGVPETSFSVP
jgi:hypothetical protein